MTQDSLLAEALSAISGGVGTFDELLDHCLDHTDLIRLAEAEDVNADDYLLFVLEDSDRVAVTEDERVIRLDLLADGLVFTHRLTRDEVEGDMVEMNPDLAGLDLGTRHIHGPDGPITLEFDRSGYSPHGSLVGPPGWLAAFSPGDLVAFRRSGDSVTVEAAGDVEDGTDEAAALQRAFEEVVGFEEEIGQEPWIILEEMLVTDPGLFRRPVRPISELLEDAGLTADGAFVGPADSNWDPPGVAVQKEFRAGIIRRYGFEACCAEALDVVIEAFRSLASGGHLNDREVNRALRHSRVAEAFCDWVDRFYALDDARVGEFARALISSGRRHTGGAGLVLARHLEAAGDALGAEAALEAAVRSDPEFGPALTESAWYASDRGDADRTVSLMRRAGIPDDDPWVTFHATLGTATETVGRNDPCPCGSGRKYKQCHLGRVELTVPERVRWLLFKLIGYVTRPAHSSRLTGLAASAMWDDFEIEDMARMRQDGFILELAVFEDGGLSDFLDERGVLLPEDERDILETWEDSARVGLWEIGDTDGTSRITLRDTATGAEETVTDRFGATQVQPGDQLLMRLLPAGGARWISTAVVPIAPQHRDSLMQLLDDYYDADSLAHWYGALHAPPRLSNREEESLVLTTLELSPRTSWEELEAILDDSFEADEDNPGVWHEFLTLDEDQRLIRAVLRREGDHLEVDVNSNERLERVLAVLDPVAEVVSRSSLPVATAADLKRMTAGSDAPPDPAPELPADVLEEVRERIERQWLDEEVPALGGLTLREAAADPTRREDLVTLLRSFERVPLSGDLAMRPDVLRRELGIEG